MFVPRRCLAFGTFVTVAFLAGCQHPLTAEELAQQHIHNPMLSSEEVLQLHHEHKGSAKFAQFMNEYQQDLAKLQAPEEFARGAPLRAAEEAEHQKLVSTPREIGSDEKQFVGVWHGKADDWLEEGPAVYTIKLGGDGLGTMEYHSTVIAKQSSSPIAWGYDSGELNFGTRASYPAKLSGGRLHMSWGKGSNLHKMVFSK
jgi:hypothetical protein